MDLDEIDFDLLRLFDYGDEHGVSPFQMYRLLNERVRLAYLITADLEDQQAEDPFPMPSTATH